MKRAGSILRTAAWLFALHSCALAAWAAPCAVGRQIHSLLEQALQFSVGIKIPDAAELNCPSVLTGAESLVIASIRRDSLLHSMEARFECAHGACLPFAVRVELPEAALVSEFGKEAGRGSKPRRTATANQRLVSASENLVRPGEMVTLLWEDTPMRITRTMVCLDRGGKGQPVRTRAKEGGRVVRARVLSAGIVKAEP